MGLRGWSKILKSKRSTLYGLHFFDRHAGAPYTTYATTGGLKETRISKARTSSKRRSFLS